MTTKTRFTTPTCPKCGAAAGFEMQGLKVRNSNNELAAINCAVCGAVVAVIENHNINDRLELIMDKLGIVWRE